MKIYYFLIFAFMFVCLQSYAAVVDQYKCQTKFSATEIQYPDITSQFEMNMVRLPLPENDIYSSTKATSYQNLEIKTPRKDTYSIKMDYTYIHALKKVSEGLPIDGRLATCLNVVVSTNGAPIDFNCLEITPDPFDESSNRWLKVSVSDGIPSVPVRVWKFAVDLPEGNLNITCQRTGIIK